MTGNSDLNAPESGAQSRFALSSGTIAFVLTCVASLPIFWFGLQALLRAWSTAEYSHGPIIPLVSLYLFLRERRSLGTFARPAGSTSRLPGLFLIGVSLAIAIMGNFMQVSDIVAYAFILWVGGMVLTTYGWAEGRRHWAPVVHLIFMLPLPQIIYWKMNVFLQGVSSELGVWFLTLFGVPVFLEGNVIDLGVFKLQVAEACSGLRYLFPILSFSYLFAILYKGPMWHKVLLLVSAAPLTVLMNSVRIAITGVLVNQYGIEQAQGFLHYFEGWVIFIACVLILFAFAIILQRTTKDPKPLGEAIDLDTEGLATIVAGFTKIRATKGLWSAFALALIVTSVWLAVPRAAPLEVTREPFALFPRSIDDWRGYTHILEKNIEETLGADDYLHSAFTSKSEDQDVALFVAFYSDQSSGEGIHSPEICLPGGGWEIFSLEPHAIDMSHTPYGAFEVNRAIIQKGVAQQLVYYWFEQRGKRYTNDVRAKLSVLYDSFSLGRADGALIRYVTRIGADEDIAVAEARLQRFMRESLPKIPRFVPN